jgi:Ca2+-binding EF-hand superfamily protein
LAQIQVDLVFPDGSKHAYGTDPRTTYSVVDAAAPFVVETNGIVQTDTSVCTAGSWDVNVAVDGQSVTDVVTIIIVAFSHLELTVAPFPSYSGSSVDLRESLIPYGVASLGFKVARVACTAPAQYQQASFGVNLHLTNGVQKAIASQHTSLAITNYDADSTETRATESNRVLTATSPGSVVMTATFVSVQASMPVAIDDTAVTISSFTGLSMVVDGAVKTTLTGDFGKTAALRVGVIYSDGRQYPTNSNDYLNDVFTFASAVSAAIAVEPETGSVELVNNFQGPVALSVSTCADNGEQHPSGGSVDVSANLKPVALGDVDLGSESNAPVAPQTIGSKFTLKARVNTGGVAIGAIGVRLMFDPTKLVPVSGSVQHTIPLSDGSVDFQATTSTDGDELIVVATIQDSQVAGGTNGVEIFEVEFEMLADGLTAITGVTEQLLDGTLASNEIIAASRDAPVAFIAGNIKVQIGSARRKQRRQRRDRQLSAKQDDGVANKQRAHIAAAADRARRQNRRADDEVRGDANCDGTFDLKDSLRILQYLVSSEGDATRTLVEECQAARGATGSEFTFLDSDKNGLVEGLDSTYLSSVYLGVFSFWSISTVTNGAICNFQVSIAAEGVGGAAPRVGTTFFAHISHTSAWSADFGSALSASDGFVTANGESSALVQAAATGTPGTFVFVLNAGVAFDVEDLGVSIVQVTSAEILAGSPKTWKFFDTIVPTDATAQVTSPVTYTAEDLGANLPMAKPAGFNNFALIAPVAFPRDCGTTSVTSTPTTTPTQSTTTTTTTTTGTFTTITTTTTTTITTTSTRPELCSAEQAASFKEVGVITYKIDARSWTAQELNEVGITTVDAANAKIAAAKSRLISRTAVLGAEDQNNPTTDDGDVVICAVVELGSIIVRLFSDCSFCEDTLQSSSEALEESVLADQFAVNLTVSPDKLVLVAGDYDHGQNVTIVPGPAASLADDEASMGLYGGVGAVGLLVLIMAAAVLVHRNKTLDAHKRVMSKDGGNLWQAEQRNATSKFVNDAAFEDFAFQDGQLSHSPKRKQGGGGLSAYQTPSHGRRPSVAAKDDALAMNQSPADSVGYISVNSPQNMASPTSHFYPKGNSFHAQPTLLAPVTARKPSITMQMPFAGIAEDAEGLENPGYRAAMSPLKSPSAISSTGADFSYGATRASVRTAPVAVPRVSQSEHAFNNAIALELAGGLNRRPTLEPDDESDLMLGIANRPSLAWGSDDDDGQDEFAATAAILSNMDQNGNTAGGGGGGADYLDGNTLENKGTAAGRTDEFDDAADVLAQAAMKSDYNDLFAHFNTFDIDSNGTIPEAQLRAALNQPALVRICKQNNVNPQTLFSELSDKTHHVNVMDFLRATGGELIDVRDIESVQLEKLNTKLTKAKVKRRSTGGGEALDFGKLSALFRKIDVEGHGRIGRESMRSSLAAEKGLMQQVAPLGYVVLPLHQTLFCSG